MSLTEQEKRSALSYAFKGAQFMFIPSESLCLKIVNSHSLTENLNDQLRIHLLEKQYLRLSTNMIVQYCRDALDSKNTWLLDQGDIKVIPKSFELENKGENE